MCWELAETLEIIYLELLFTVEVTEPQSSCDFPQASWGFCFLRRKHFKYIEKIYFFINMVKNFMHLFAQLSLRVFNQMQT